MVQAAHGEEALALLETAGSFDALVTDFAMPGIDGGELVRQAQALRPRLPALIVTGYADRDTLATVPAHVPLVRKPVRGDALVGHVHGLIAAAAGVTASGVTASGAK